MNEAKKSVAIWRWDRGEPVPDARLVVCASGLRESPKASDGAARREVWGRPSQWFIVPGAWEPSDSPPRWIIPAIHVTTQADLDGRVCPVCVQYGSSNDPSYTHLCGNCARTGHIGGIRALIGVQAERRALVLSPKEAIDLTAALRCGGCNGAGHVDEPIIRPCAECCGDGVASIDLVVVTGFDEPLHPEHVRSVVRQCREAGVPCVFAGWGDWCPWDQMPRDEGGEFPWGERDGLDRRIAFGLPFYRAARAIPTTSARALVEKPVCDWPEWLRSD